MKPKLLTYTLFLLILLIYQTNGKFIKIKSRSVAENQETNLLESQEPLVKDVSFSSVSLAMPEVSTKPNVNFPSKKKSKETNAMPEANAMPKAAPPRGSRKNNKGHPRFQQYYYPSQGG